MPPRSKKKVNNSKTNNQRVSWHLHAGWTVSGPGLTPWDKSLLQNSCWSTSGNTKCKKRIKKNPASLHYFLLLLLCPSAEPFPTHRMFGCLCLIIKIKYTVSGPATAGMIPGIKTPHIVRRNAFTIFSAISVSFNFIRADFAGFSIFPSGLNAF